MDRAISLFFRVAGIILAVCAAGSCTARVEYDWSPAGDNIRTCWAAEVSPTSAHPEYPRPQLVREEWESLNGMWEYAVTPAEAESFGEPDGGILVPFCIESSLSGVGRTVTADDALWYRRTFRVPRSWRGRRIMLNFDAVDWQAQVFVNGEEVGSHTGGYTAFSFDITPYLKGRGEQELTVKVLDGTDNEFQPRGKQVSKPSGIWYTAVSGIWQSVWMEPVEKGSIYDFEISADLEGGALRVMPLYSSSSEGNEVRVALLAGGVGYDPEHPSTEVLCEVSAEAGSAVSLPLVDPQLWSPECPYLYGLRFTVLKDGKVIDQVQSYTALREISVVTDAAGHKRLGFNGKALFQYGPLDQGWWPDGLYTAPTDEALAYDVAATKEFGFNMIRKHIKVEPSRWYYHCDRLGMLVWQDMPSFSSSKNQWAQGIDRFDTGTDYPVTPEIRDNYYKEWGEIIAQLKKFPCIVMWVPFNEAWGQFDTREVVAFTREQDPSRLVDPASGGNWPSATGDVVDSHHYPQPYMRLWNPELVNVLGEYGGIGRPIEGHLWQKDRNWGYVQYATEEEATDEYVRFAEQLLPFVEQGCSAAVYTQTTDVEGEVNGLMTYDRAIKKLTVDRVSAANRSVIGSLPE